MRNRHPALIGFLQALSVALYCGLIGLFFNLAKNISPQPPEFWGTVVLLLLLVFSAAVTGLLVFGYPAFLILEREIKKALQILAHTFLFSLIIIGAVLLIIALV